MHTQTCVHNNMYVCIYRLKRGYKDAASHEHRDPPIGHLVLIVHGIGQCSGSADICKDTKKLDTCSIIIG